MMKGVIRITATLCILLTTGIRVHAETLKIATLSPEGSVWMEKMRAGAAEVAKKTDQRVNIKYYPGGVMGDDKAVLRKIRIGQLQGGAVVSGSMAQFFPDSQIYTSLPLEFRTFEEIDRVRKPIDPIIIKGFEKNGFAVFGLAGGGFAYILSGAAIRTIEDLRKQKVWVPDNDSIAIDAVKAFDITPIPLSIADVRAGLQSGLINTVATPPVGALALQWHTQVKYLMDLPFLYIYAMLAVDQKAFSKLSPEDQSVTREVMGGVFGEIDRLNREDHVKSLEALRKQGIEFIKPPEEAVKEWYEKSAEVRRRLLENGKLSRDLLTALEKILEEYRAGKSE